MEKKNIMYFLTLLLIQCNEENMYSYVEVNYIFQCFTI